MLADPRVLEDVKTDFFVLTCVFAWDFGHASWAMRAHSIHPLYVHVWITGWWLEPNVLTTARCRFAVARDADLDDVARDKIPPKTMV